LVQGLPDLQAFGQSQTVVEQIKRRGDGLLRSQQQMANINSLQSMAVSHLSGLGMWAVLILAIPLVANGQLDGIFLAVLALSALTSFEAVNPLPVAAQYLESNLQAAQRLFEVVDAEPDVMDPPAPFMPPAKLDLSVRELNFHYPGGEDVLHGFSFDLPQGKRIGIVGASGSGKSTLVNLLLRFWDVFPGHIMLGGIDLRLFDQEKVRSRMGVVPQQVFLFDQSIRDNLCIGCGDLSDEEIVRAANIVQLHDFILNLPEGYDTWVGEQGVRISGGERQRIAIARALLHLQAHGLGGLLILDEGTAHLDARMEREVIHSILEHTIDQSLLLISHRLVGMEAMDEILVLDHGEVVERGTHADLLTADGIYSRMWSIQNNLIFQE
jgi:ATP-binding cassette subfamily C protein CydC